jgi:predicted lipoprotein with Yx(FWY)xxD motif
MLSMKNLSLLRRHRGLAAVGMVAVALLVAACGSAAKSASTAVGANASDVSSSGSLTIGTAHGSAGTYLVGAGNRAIYLWVADGRNMSHCSGACASIWPPVTTHATAHAGAGVHASALGTINGAGGAKQVTYDGHPLYYYAGDSHAGSTTGQGSDSFGAKWWLVSAGGNAITAHNTPAAASTTGAKPSGANGSSAVTY